MARYELILKLDGALWLTIISKTPLTQKTAISKNGSKEVAKYGGHFFWKKTALGTPASRSWLSEIDGGIFAYRGFVMLPKS